MEKEKEEPSQSWLQKVENQWERTKNHINSYPYVWASYAFVYSYLTVYTAYRWRRLRKAEDDLLRYQEKLMRNMTPESVAEALKEAEKGNKM